MTYAAHPAVFHGQVEGNRRAVEVEGRARPGFLRRLLDAMFESRQRAAEREIDVYLRRTGGRFTDSIEREINERQFNQGWNLRN